MCSRYLSDQKHAEHGWLYHEGGGVLRLDAARLRPWLEMVAARIGRHDAGRCSSPSSPPAISTSRCPRASSRRRTPASLRASRRRAQDISFAAMAQHQLALADIIARDPAVADVAFVVGVTGGIAANNNGRFWINLKPRDQRDRHGRPDHQPPAAAARQGPGHRRFLQAQQDVNIGGRLPVRNIQYTLQDANLDELDSLGADHAGKLRTLPELRDVATDQQIARPTAAVDHRPRHGGAVRHPAAGHRRHALRRVRPALGDAILHPAQPVSRGHGDRAEAAGRSRGARPALHQIAATGQPVPLVALVKVDTSKTNYLTDQPSGPVSGGDDLLQSAAGRRAQRSARRDPAGGARCDKPLRLQATFQGTAQAFQASLATQPMLILAAIVAVYIILGMLYESYIHPITILSTLPSAGRRRAAGAAGRRLRTEHHRADRHHPADRHREEERDHDDRLRAGGGARARA